MATVEGSGFQVAAPVPPEAGTAGGPIPWEDPGLPRLRGLGRTLRQLLFSPQDFFRRLGHNGGGEALAFGLIAGTAGLLAGLFWSSLFYAAAGRAVEASWGLSRFEAGTGLTIFLMAAAPALNLFNLAFGAGCLWGAVALAGGGRDFNPVWRIYCYAQGGMLAGVIPLLGLPLAGLWVLYLVYLGVQAVFETSPGRTLGVLFLFLVLQVFLVLLLLGILLALLAFLGFLLFLG